MNGLHVCVGRFIKERLNYMYEFEKHPKLTEFIQEMANTGKAPQEWTSFIETLNEALRIHDVVERSEQLKVEDKDLPFADYLEKWYKLPRYEKVYDRKDGKGTDTEDEVIKNYRRAFRL